MTECHTKNQKFTRFSPGCGGRVEYPPGLSKPSDPKKPFGRMRRVKGKTCRLHWLEYGFGLIALECPECKKQDKTTLRDQIQAQTDISMEDDEKYTYVPMELLFAPARHTWYLKKTDIPAFTIRCWNCGFVFWKGRKATKAERKKNEKIAWEEIPEASPELLKIIKGDKKGKSQS